MQTAPPINVFFLPERFINSKTPLCWVRPFPLDVSPHSPVLSPRWAFTRLPSINVREGRNSFVAERGRPPTASPFNALAWLSARHNQSHRTTSSPPLRNVWPSTLEFLETCFCTYTQEYADHECGYVSPATKLSDCQMKLAASPTLRQGHLSMYLCLGLPRDGGFYGFYDFAWIEELSASVCQRHHHEARVTVEALWSGDTFCQRSDKINCK